MSDWFNSIALDENDERVSIEDTVPGHKYHCDACNFEMIPRKGLVRIHHFAHVPGSECVDSWTRYYDTSEWHRKWLQKFPVKNREHVIKKDGATHRADVFINRTVIEFQHNKISPKHFRDRNDFYRSCGFEVIWVFDVVDDYESGNFSRLSTFKYKWSKMPKVFQDYCMEEGVNIYFQIMRDETDDSNFQECHANSDRLNDQTHDTNYCEVHKDKVMTIIKVVSMNCDGDLFIQTDGNVYYEGDFLSEYIPIANTVRRTVIGDISEGLAYSYRYQIDSLYEGCPISNSGLCTGSAKALTENKYKDIMPCSICGHGDANRSMCRKRIDDLDLPVDAIVTHVKRNYLNKIEKLRVVVNGEPKEFVFPPIISKGNSFLSNCDTILSLSKKLNVSEAIFRNEITGEEFKVTSNPNDQYRKYWRCYGYRKDDNGEFSADSKEISCISKSIWTCIWHKTKEKEVLKPKQSVIVGRFPEEQPTHRSEYVGPSLFDEDKTDYRTHSDAKETKESVPSAKTKLDSLCDDINEGKVTIADMLTVASKKPDILPNSLKTGYVINVKDSRAFYIGSYHFKTYNDYCELKAPVNRKKNPKVEVYFLQNADNEEWVYFSPEDMVI